MNRATLSEDFSRKHKIKPSSDRVFGIIIGFILMLIGWWGYSVDAKYTAIVVFISFFFFLSAWLRPSLLKYFNLYWTRFGLLLHTFINPLLMFCIYIIAIVPTGLILRMFGKDVLSLKINKNAKSYWIKCDPLDPEIISMRDQF